MSIKMCALTNVTLRYCEIATQVAQISAEADRQILSVLNVAEKLQGW